MIVREVVVEPLIVPVVVVDAAVEVMNTPLVVTIEEDTYRVH